MQHTTREGRLAAALLEAADTLADGFDTAAHLRLVSARCAELLAARAVGIMLVGDGGETLAAGGSGRLAAVLLKAQRGGGPCAESHRTGRAVPPVSLRSPQVAARWPEFTSVALRHGIGTTFAVPLRRGGSLLGALNVFDANQQVPGGSSGVVRAPGVVGALGATDAPGTADAPGAVGASGPAGASGLVGASASVVTAQSFADAAALGLYNHRAHDQFRTLSGQLQHALTSRVHIEQAKGILAERRRVSVDEAFDVLRGYARRNRLPLDSVARSIVEQTLGDTELGDHQVPRPPRPPRGLSHTWRDTCGDDG
ncbi:ANTAR domain-containing protein [Streptomyces niveiscabiei]|uniref:GAF and ANTAR domain-containing protein n=2 Tax=Streptomyces TaxID=1883 RepID=UPI001F0C870D|nr:GAF and ANTAR domain-containing protein [Streptomyces sp. V2]